jgi:hypothetical protein
MSLKSLRELFYEHEGKLIHKWDHYFEVYERYLSSYRGRQVNLLEIGISHGGSIQLWKKYFGPKAHIYAIDVNPECKKLEEENTTIFIGSQSDRRFLNEILPTLPELDIIIDDGGHMMKQQIVSFETLYQKVREGGVYIVEDTHTSYWYEFKGGLKKPGTFIEYSKNLVDSLYDEHVRDRNKLIINGITKHVNSISFYDSIVVFEKLERKKPFHIKKGTETIQPWVQKELKKENLLSRARAKIFGKHVHSFDLNDRGKAG